MKIVKFFESDWLNSNPFFYNTQTCEVSVNINDVIDKSNFEWNLKGLNNYLKYGYSVFEETPIKNVKFSRYSSKIIQYINDDGKKEIKVEYLEDPILNYINKKSSVKEVLNHGERIIDNLERKAKLENKKIILPLSGGHDSKFLASLIKDSSNVHAFTYSLNLSQNCFEALFAKEIAKRLNIKWDLITLRDFLSKEYCKQAFSRYGISMNLHEMYHSEMYKKIKTLHHNGGFVLSGFVMDAFSRILFTKKDLETGYNHGISISEEYFVNKNDKYINIEDENNKSSIEINVNVVRLKVGGLLRYLIQTPKNYNFESVAPVLDIDFAMSQLTLPEEDLLNRKWQKDYFKSKNLDISQMQNINCVYSNRLDGIAFQSSFDITDMLLNVKILKQFVKEERLNWINEKLLWLKSTQLLTLEDFVYNIDFSNLLFSRRVGNFFNRIKDKSFNLLYNKKISDGIVAFNEWSVLKPIEYLQNSIYDKDS